MFTNIKILLLKCFLKYGNLIHIHYCVLFKLKIKKGSRDQSSVATAAKSKETRNTEDFEIEIINPYFWLATIDG